MTQSKIKNQWFVVIILMASFSQLMASSSVGKRNIEGTPGDENALVYETEDVALDAEVAEFLAYKPDVQWQENAYVYLWGMDRETDDVYQTGLEILQQVAAADQAFDYINDYNNEFLLKYETIELPKHKDFCSFLEADCFAKTWVHLDKLLLQLEDHQTLMSRYIRFFSYKVYARPMLMTSESPFPNLRSLTIGQRLLHLKMLSDLKAGKIKKALAQIKKQNQEIRNKLSQTNGLIDKMVMTAMLAELIEFVHIGYTKKWLSGKEIKATGILKPLTKEELSVHEPMFMEYQTMMQMLHVVLSQELSSLQTEPSHWIFEFFPDLPKAMIKPNLFLNVQYHEHIKLNLAVHKQDANEYYSGYESLDIVVGHDLARNAVGKVFNLTAQENKEIYLHYQVRLYDLDMKIQLLRAVIEEGGVSQLMEAVKKEPTKYPNSYDSSAPFKDENKICYSGLDEKNLKYRCLFILD